MKGTGVLGIALIGIGVAWLLVRETGKKTTRAILDELFPFGFTASGTQLDILVAAGYPAGSKVYEEAVKLALADVARTCQPGESVHWSSAQGYYCAIPAPDYG